MPSDGGADHVPHGEHAERAYVAARTLAVLYARMPAILAANVINSTLTAAIFFDAVPALTLGLWLGLTWLLTLGRLAQWLRLRDRDKPNWVAHCRWSSRIGSWSSGALWGAAGFFFFVPGSPLHLAALVFVLGGMAAGALTTIYAHPLAFNGYLLLSMVPFALRLALGGGPDHWLMAAMVFLFIVSLVVIGRQTYRDLVRRFTVQFENLELIRGLERRVENRTHRHATLVEFSHRALSGLDTDTLLRDAVTIIRSGLPARLALAWEWSPRDGVLRARAFSAEDTFVPGDMTQPDGAGSQAGYTLARGEPVISGNPAAEVRFAVPPALRRCGVTSTLSVPIWGHGAPFGVLEAWDANGRTFAADDVNFVRAVSTTIAAAHDRRRAEDGLERLALHDALTGLPNRALFQEHLGNAVNKADRNGALLAVLLIDLDEFKDVNDTLGHAAGDQLLAQVAQRLRDCTRKGDPPARLGGDEFAVVLPDIKSPDAAAAVAEKIVHTLIEPFSLGAEGVHVGASVGITVYPVDGHDPSQLLRNADLALYKAKTGGRRTYAFYSPDMAVDVEQRIDLLRDLRGAIAGNELDLDYQPQVDVASGAISGAEALIRWRNPRLGRIRPQSFIPLAESSGIIGSVGDWAMRHACQQGLAWQRLGLPDITMAVNVSPAQWRRMSTATTVDRVLRARDAGPAVLELEITERAFPISDHGQMLDCLKLLRREGISISIDDFGTGYSNLARLRQLPVDKIKIDRSFIGGLGCDHNDEIIVRAIISLARNLGLKVVAEGVEEREQLDFLRAEGCDLVQGHLLGCPVDAEAFPFLFKDRLH